jgi:hypothetical protein
VPKVGARWPATSTGATSTKTPELGLGGGATQNRTEDLSIIGAGRMTFAARPWHTVPGQERPPPLR